VKVLVLGGAGYIGNALCTYLQERGEEVTVLDACLFDQHHTMSSPGEFIRGDIRNLNDLLPAIVQAEAVVNLAAISNDPASDLRPELTWETNYKANETIAQLCQSTGKRVVYASSCSVYGFSPEGVFDETSKLAPVTLYAHTKMLSEQHYLHEDINALILRFATVHGYSARPRFDLVVNTMVGSGLFKGKIVVNGGAQWRPIVHVNDVVKAIYLALHAQNPQHRVYNVGSNDQNYKIGTLATKIAENLPDVEVINREENLDQRSYKVDFSLIAKELQFEPEYTIADTVSEFRKVYEAGGISSMEEDAYYRVKYLNERLTKTEDLVRSEEGRFYLPLNIRHDGVRYQALLKELAESEAKRSEADSARNGTKNGTKIVRPFTFLLAVFVLTIISSVLMMDS
jgi:nucleoside-diphosphate-sugar epimerase